MKKRKRMKRWQRENFRLNYLWEEKFEIVIPHMVYAKIMHWIRTAGDYEVSGFGKVIRDGTQFRVVDTHLVKQECSMGGTHLDAQALNALDYEMRDLPGDFNFWWHSHHSMSAFFSHTDNTTIREIGANGWVLAVVFNRFGEYQATLFDKNRIPRRTSKIPVRVQLPVEYSCYEEWTKQYESVVTNREPADVVDLVGWERDRKLDNAADKERITNHGEC